MKKIIDLNLKKEILRKAIHLSSLWMPLIVWYVDKNLVILIFSVCFLLLGIIEILRAKSQYARNLFHKLFYKILRSHEKTKKSKHIKLSGSFYVTLSTLIAVILFTKIIATTAITIMLISDTFAALAGKMYGRTKLNGNKTLEGSIAFFLSGILTIFAIGLLTAQDANYLMFSSICLIIATIIELFSKSLKIDDNLSIVLAFGLPMSLLY